MSAISSSPSNPDKFDYQSLNSETQQQIQTLTNDIKNRLRRCAEDIICIGNHLHQIKQQLPHGQFRPWLKAEFGWSVSAANKFMQVGKCFQVEDVAEIEIAPSALYVLAAPSTPEAVRTQILQQAKQGQPISFSLAKQLVAESKMAETSIESPPQEADKNASFSLKEMAEERLIIETSLSHAIKIYSFSDFQHYLLQEWRRMAREQQELSLMICQINISCTSSPETVYRENIRQITYEIAGLLHRPADFISYYGKGQWMLVLPNTDVKGTQAVAVRCLNWFNQWKPSFNHSHSLKVEDLYIGRATVIPDANLSFDILINQAQSSLTKAQEWEQADIIGA